MRDINKGLSRQSKAVKALVSSNYQNERRYVKDMEKIEREIEGSIGHNQSSVGSDVGKN